MKARLLVAALVVVAAVGAGAAVGLAQSGADDEREAFLDDVAGRLDVAPERLREALKDASLAQVERLLEAGELTEAQADRMRAAIEAGRVHGLAPKLRGRGGAERGGRLHHGLFGSLDAATEYLGLTREQLLQRLRAGDSLADVARAEGKTVEGLRDALLAQVRERLDAAQAAGRLDAARRAELLERMSERVDALLERSGPFPGGGHQGRPGRRGTSGPPPAPEPSFAA